MSTASRFEVEHLHRLMMRSSVDAAALERSAREAEHDHGLQDLLGDWKDAVATIGAAFNRARTDLQRDGTPKDEILRVEDCLTYLKACVNAFEVGDSLEEFAGRWQSLSFEIRQLSGAQRDALVRLFAGLQVTIDRVTGALNQAQKNAGLAPEKHRIARDLRGQADRARERYQRLREQYLEAAGADQKWLAEQQAAQREAELARYSNSAVRATPAIVRLPDPRQPGLGAVPGKLPKLVAQSTPSIPSGQREPPGSGFNPYLGAHRGGPTLRPGKVIPARPPAPFSPLVKPNQIGQLPRPKPIEGRQQIAPAQSLLHAQRPVVTHSAAAVRPSGPLKVSVERIERIAGFPSGVDGIGRGNQTAHIFFRAENFHGGLSVGGTHDVSLGASCRLDIAPLVTIFSSVPGAPLRGKLSLGLVSSGGRLVGVKPREAHDLARGQARGAARAVAEKVGPLGKELASAIAAVLEDAADKIFSRAQAGAVQHRLPPNHGTHHHPHPAQQHGHHRQQHESHHLGHFNHLLGEILHQAREAKAPGGRKQQKHQGMHHLVHHEQHHHVASRLEKTLAHLATATHRVLTDTSAGELRGQLARLDALLARLNGKVGHELFEGAQAIGQVLSQMGGVVSSAGGAPHLASFRGPLNERRGQLAQITGAARKQMGAELAHKHGKPGFQMPSAQVLGEKALESLRKQHPGLEKLLRNASHSQLAQELARKAAGGLEEIFAGGHGQQAKHGKHPRRQQHGQRAARGLGGVGLGGIGSALFGGGHLGGFGGRGGIGELGGHASAMTKIFSQELEHQARRAGAKEIGKLLGHFKTAPQGSPLHRIALQAEERSKHLHARHGGRKGKAPAHFTAQALLEAFKTHGKGSFAAHVAPGGALYQICHSTQRTRGGPISATASHYLQGRGQSPLWNAVSTFHGLVKEGHRPHHSLSSWAKDRSVSSFAKLVSGNVSRVTALASAAVSTIPAGLSSLGSRAAPAVRGSTSTDKGMGHQLWDSASGLGEVAWAGMSKKGAGALEKGAGMRAVGGGLSWAQRTVGGASNWLGNQLPRANGFAGELAHKGIEWVNKTGVVGAIGTGLRGGMHLLGNVVKCSPLGLAARAGWGLVKNPLGIWDKTKKSAGNALDGIKSAHQATSGFLRSPAGQFLVTGLSLAASFIPGGILVKSLLGAGIGAIQALSEGKDLKHILLSAGSGALTGALPFLKIGPLAKVGMGALTGAVTSLAGGGNFKDALKAGGGGALDAFDPGAMKSLGKLKTLAGAEKLLKGGKLGELEKLAVSGGKRGGPLRLLEKALANPKIRKTLTGLEKLGGGKVAKGGIFLSGKATQVQGGLDKALEMGDKLDGALVQIHDQAPAVAGFFGETAVGHFIGKVGDYAGKGDEKLHQALEYGHTASDKLTQYRGYLDKGLNFVGARDHSKASTKMSRTGKSPKHGNEPETALEKALAKGKSLQKKGVAIAQSMHDKTGKLGDIVEKGLKGASAVQSGLEKASALAKQGAGSLGEESELGHYLLEVSERAAQIHGYLETGIGYAETFQKGVSTVHDLGGADKKHDGTHGAGHGHALDEAQYLEGGAAKGERRHGTSADHHPHHGEAPQLSHDLRKKSEHGLKAIEAYKRQALKRGHQVDPNLAKVEQALKRGIAIGAKVDKGMEKIGSIADQVAGFLGDDSPLGHLAHQAAQTAHAGHDKLHSALGMASKGKAGLSKGRDLLREMMGKAAEEHGKRQRGPHPHRAAHPHHAAHPQHGGGLPLPHLHLPHRQMPERLKHSLGIAQHASPGSTTVQAPKHQAAPAELVTEAAKAVQEFGKAVKTTIAEVEKLMHAKKAKEAGDRVHAVSGVSETTRAKVVTAVTASSKHPALHKHAASLKAHYLEIRAHLFQFVHTLHGLAGQDGGGVDPRKYPDLHQVAVAIDSLGVKVTALGDLQHGDSHLEANVNALKREAAALHKQLDSLHSKHAKDRAAEEAIQSLFSKLGRLQRMLSAHSDPANLQAGNQNLELKQKEPTKHPRHKKRSKPQHHDPISELLGAGEDGRIFVDRGANRGEADHADWQGIDPAAIDTWLGSGEGVKLFSNVFGAFLPAEGAPKGGTLHQHHGHAAPSGAGGEHRDPHFGHHGLGEHGGGEPHQAPVHHGWAPLHHRGKQKRGHKKGRRYLPKPGKSSGGGFFHDLFEHLEQFADRVTHAAQAGESLLGRAMFYAEEGIHRLKAVERAADKVHDFADKAEGFFEKYHLGKAAHFAHQIGSAAGTVDRDAKLLQGGLTTADQWMGAGKKDLGAVAGLSRKASGAFRLAEHNQFGGLLSLFKASRGGDGIDGKLQPEKAQLGSNFDEPRRIDGGTLSKMEGFFGGNFAHVRIHTGPGAGIITRKFDAEAVTVKDHIFFAPGRFNTQSVEGQKLLAHELTHVTQMGRANLDVRTAEGEALRAEHSFGAPAMETLNLSQPQADFTLADGEGLGASTGIHTAKRSRSKGHEVGGKDQLPDGEEFLEKVSNRVYDLLMEELEQSFESR